MERKTLLIYTETPLHIGCGKDLGAIDMPVARERISGQPIIPGSSLKGSLRHLVEHELQNKGEALEIFGSEDEKKPGKVVFTEGRLVTFPIRSPKGGFAFTTSKSCLERLARSLKAKLKIPEVDDNTCLADTAVRTQNGKVVLEDYCFTCAGGIPTGVKEKLRDLIDDPVYKIGTEKLVILSEGDFSYFCENATEVTTHNRIGAEGVVEDKALFNMEAVPSETLFAATILEAAGTEALGKLGELIMGNPLLQLGGKATTGRGICNIKVIP